LYQIHADRLAGASSKQLLELGNAYDAAKALRDVYGQELTPEMQGVIDHFEGIEKSAKKSTAVVTQSAQATPTASSATKGGKKGKSDAERELERKTDQFRKLAQKKERLRKDQDIT